MFEFNLQTYVPISGRITASFLWIFPFPKFCFPIGPSLLSFSLNNIRSPVFVLVPIQIHLFDEDQNKALSSHMGLGGGGGEAVVFMKGVTDTRGGG